MISGSFQAREKTRTTMQASESKSIDGPIAGQMHASNAGIGQVQEARSVPPSPTRARSLCALLAAASPERSVKVPHRFTPGHDQEGRKPSNSGACDSRTFKSVRFRRRKIQIFTNSANSNSQIVSRRGGIDCSRPPQRIHIRSDAPVPVAVPGGTTSLRSPRVARRSAPG